MISADEKSQLQALGRRHETVPAAPRHPMRCEFEYRRGGTLAYLAAWDVHHARLFDRVEEKTGIESFGRLVEQVMGSEPYASAKRVSWVVDNGSSHAGRASIERLEGKWRSLRLIHLPVHASWLNQIELYFSIVQRKALTPTSPPWRSSPSACSPSAAATARSLARSSGRSRAPISSGCSSALMPSRPAMSLLTCGSRPDASGREQDAGGGSARGLTPQAASRTPAGVRAAPALTATA